MSMLSLLKYHVQKHGPIATARISSARVRGAAKRYSYWGVVRYEIRMGTKRKLINTPLECASGDTRSLNLARKYCDELCRKEGRIPLQKIGTLTEFDAYTIVSLMPEYNKAIEKYVLRRKYNDKEEPPLTLEQRFVVYLASKIGLLPRKDAENFVRHGALYRRGRFIYQRYNPIRWTLLYVAYGDDRDIEAYNKETKGSAEQLSIISSCGERVLPVLETRVIDSKEGSHLLQLTIEDPRSTTGTVEKKKIVLTDKVLGSTREYVVDLNCKTVEEAMACALLNTLD